MLVGHRLENSRNFLWHGMCFRSLLCCWEPHNPPPSVLQVYPTSCFLLFFLQKCPENTVQQHLLKQRNTICKILQRFSLLVQLGTREGFQEELFDLQHMGTWLSTNYFSGHPSSSRPSGTVCHIPQWLDSSSNISPDSSSVEFYPIPILLQWCTDTHHPTRVWHLLIASNVDARESGRLLLVKLSDLLSKQSRKHCIACSAVQVSPTSLNLHEETSISIH